MSNCLKCKQITGDSSPHVTQASNGRYMKKSKCSVCGTNKCKFISNAEAKKSGDGFFGNLIGSVLPF